MSRHVAESHLNIIHNMEPYIKPARFDRLSRGKQFFDFFTGQERKVYLIKEGDFIIRSKMEIKSSISLRGRLSSAPCRHWKHRRYSLRKSTTEKSTALNITSSGAS